MARNVSKLYGKVAPLPSRGAWRSHFDPNLYSALNTDLSFRNRGHCYTHFRFRGYKQLRPFSALRPFDATFYTAFYADLNGFDLVAAYKHWLLHGIEEGRVQSSAALLDNLRYPSSRLPDELISYFENIAKGDHSRLWHVAEEFLRSGSFADIYALAPNCSLQTLKELHAYFRAKDRKDLLSEIMADRYLTDGHVLHLAADRHAAAGERFSALRSYQRALDRKGSPVWCYINAARGLLDFKDYDGAIRHAKAGLIAYSGNEALRALLRTSLLAQYDDRLSDVKSTFIRQKDAKIAKAAATEAAEYLRAGLAILYDKIAEPDCSTRQPTVAIIGSRALTQCFDYRIRQKIEAFETLGVPCTFFEWQECSTFINQCPDFTHAIFCRLPAYGNVVEAVFVAAQTGLRTAFDMDDLILDTDLYPPSYINVGGLISDAEMTSLRFDPILFSVLAAHCDVGIASTNIIKEHLASLVKCKEGLLVENGLFQQELRAASARNAPHRTNKSFSRVMLFYGSGSRSHSAAFSNTLSDALAHIMDAHPSVEVAIVGPLTLEEKLTKFGERIRHTTQLLSRERYLQELQAASINLFPLTTDRFSAAKSNIKWLEAALYSVPTVAWDSETLRGTVNDDEILLSSSRESWIENLSRLILSEEKRLALGARAHKAAVARYSAATIHKQLSRFLEWSPSSTKTGRSSARRRKILMVNVSFAPRHMVARHGSCSTMLSICNEIPTAFSTLRFLPPGKERRITILISYTSTKTYWFAASKRRRAPKTQNATSA